MRFDIYKGEQLAATFIYGRSPRFYGASGDELAALFATVPIVYNLWTGEAESAPLCERADWWAARIISAPLCRSGFALRPVAHPIGWDFEQANAEEDVARGDCPQQVCAYRYSTDKLFTWQSNGAGRLARPAGSLQ